MRVARDVAGRLCDEGIVQAHRSGAEDARVHRPERLAHADVEADVVEHVLLQTHARRDLGQDDAIGLKLDSSLLPQ